MYLTKEHRVREAITNRTEGRIDKYTIILGAFNRSLSGTDRSSWPRISKDRVT